MDDLDLLTNEEFAILENGQGIMKFLRAFRDRTGTPMAEGKALADRIRTELEIPFGLKHSKIRSGQ